MSRQLITINEEGIEKSCNEKTPVFNIDFDTSRIFGNFEFKTMQGSKSSVRHLLTIEDHRAQTISLGYTHKLDFAMEVVRQRFSQVMQTMNKECQTTKFVVEVEHPEEGTFPVVCKLRQPALVYGRHRLMTIKIEEIQRLEFPRSTTQ